VTLAHVYVLIDTSASMTGAPLAAAQQALKLLRSTLASQAARPVRLAVIGYDTAPLTLLPLADLAALADLPPLDAGGSSRLGRAFDHLAAMLAGYRPNLLYLFTDGNPNDDWAESFALLRPQLDKIIGVACGVSVEDGMLPQLADHAFALSELTPDLFFRPVRALLGK
jgi:uncharacterized protein YegL